ncbi:MAG TPA: hypothetical protein VEA58_05435 [Anaerovoracaceae bacterium]|nr:hypothetical protein [Anaerovoracaceae bacterium]
MAAITTAAIGLGTAAYTIYNSEKQRKDAADSLDNYQRQDINNAYEEMPISTFGSDLLREENARTSANMVNALQMGGSRSVFGGIPKVVGMTNQINQEAARNIDGQVINRNYAIAQDNARIEGMTENRDMQNIAALSSQENAGRQGVMNGLMGMGDSIAYGARNIDFGGGSWNDNEAAKMASLYNTPYGFNTPYSLPRTAGPSQNPQPYFDFSNSYR